MEYATVHKAYVSFLRQKSKIQWLKDGDSNTRFFHQNIKMRRCQNSIYSIVDGNGVMVNSPEKVAKAFVDYYK